MKSSDIPALFPIAFANEAEEETISPIPDTTSETGRASFARGFPKENMIPLAAGGVPPDGRDMNGILNMLSRAVRACETGEIRFFNADYARQIGGYPQGAMVMANVATPRILISLKDDNTTDPADDDNTMWVGMTDGLLSARDAQQLYQPKGNYIISGTDKNSRRIDTAGIGKDTGLLWVHGNGANTATIIPTLDWVYDNCLLLPGRLRAQVFRGNYSNGAWVQFPQAFSGNPVCLQLTIEHYPFDSPHGTSLIVNYYSSSLSTTGFRIDTRWVDGGGTDGEATPRNVSIFAIGPQ